MLLDTLVRQVTGYWDDPVPWQIVESGDMLLFRWRSLEAEWRHPAEADLEAWVRDVAIALQELCAAHLQETWEDALHTMIAERLVAAGVPADVAAQIAISFEVENEWPSHGEMAAWENRLPEGRVFVELVSDAFDMEPVDTFWLGQEEIATMADTLAAVWVERWREG